jgi:hypothetical protein
MILVTQPGSKIEFGFLKLMGIISPSVVFSRENSFSLYKKKIQRLSRWLSSV